MLLRKVTAALLLFALAFPGVAPPSVSAQRGRPVSLLLVNGKIFTADEVGTVAEAVALLENVQSRFASDY